MRTPFEEEVHQFDQIIQKPVPHCHEMLNALVFAIPFKDWAGIRVFDLGCGTGALSVRGKEVHPKARITFVGISRNLRDLAREKVGREARTQLVHFRSYGFEGSYDAVVSSLALHPLETDDERKGFYRGIFGSLSRGRVFYNADAVLGSSEDLQAGCMARWKALMRNEGSDGEIEEYWLPNYHSEDHPARLMSRLAWLDDAGFEEIDAVWKFRNFAVYGGRKK